MLLFIIHAIFRGAGVGLSNAAASLVGQNLGADQPGRAESSVWRIGFYNMAFMVAVSFVYYVFNEALIGIFTHDPEVIAIGAVWLRILSYSYFVYGWRMVSVQAFNGAGDSMTPDQNQPGFFLADSNPAIIRPGRQFRPATFGRVYIGNIRRPVPPVAVFPRWMENQNGLILRRIIGEWFTHRRVGNNILR